MTAPTKPTARQRETERVRAEIRRSVSLAHDAIDALDCGAAIAHARSLRSTLWRAKNAGIDPAALSLDGADAVAPQERS